MVCIKVNFSRESITYLLKMVKTTKKWDPEILLMDTNFKAAKCKKKKLVINLNKDLILLMLMFVYKMLLISLLL